MRNTLIACSLFLAASSAPASASVAPERPTLFWYAQTAWGVGVVEVGKPLTFADGKILVFPGQFTDLVWGPNGTRPRNMMLVHEVGSDEKDKPALREKDSFLAPIRVLPQHSYWKDNLPDTPRHQVAGGARYMFRGDDVAEARRVLTDYLAAVDMKGSDRWTRQVDAVSAALLSSLPVIREDAAVFLTDYPTLARDFSERSVAPVAAWLAGDAAADQKAALVDALAAAKVTSIKPELAKLVSRDDATGAVALQGLEAFGDAAPPTDRLLTLSKSTSPEMRSYAAEALGRRAATDPAAAAKVREILADPSALMPATAAAEGLGKTGGDASVAILADSLAAGAGSAKASAAALAAIGGPAASAALIKTLKEQKGEAALAAVSVMGQMQGCPDCVRTLEEQYKSHPDPEVRKLIGVLLEVPLQHKH